MPTVHLLRHGALPPNPERRFIGQQDIPLSAAGRRQAQFWHDALAEVPLTRAWCSDLARCRETAALVLRGRPVPLTCEGAFREISLGAWQGLTKQEVEARFAGSWTRRGENFYENAPEQGESFRMLAARVFPALRALLQCCAPQEQVLLVAHAGVNRIILAHWLALPPDAVFAVPQPYAACTTLSFAAEDIAALRAWG